MRELQIGRVYRHFKGDYYLVEGVANDSETGAPFVIYRKLYGDGGLWLRPLEMFLSKVDQEKYPDCPPMQSSCEERMSGFVIYRDDQVSCSSPREAAFR